MREFIIGPQAQINTGYFDTTQVAMAKKLGATCPAVPPTDPTALNSYALNLQYYDLPKSLYTVHARTGDPLFLQYARNAADSWWQHPWIGKGLVRPWPDNASPPPRHAGIGGLILRALDGKPEYWDFCVEYTKAFLNIYLLWRLANTKLHVDIREGAFTFHYATWLASVLPDSYPKQSGSTVTNGAEIRAQFHADLQKITIDYYERLQYPCGCWRYDVDMKDTDGGTLVGITQPFTAGLLLLAFADFHQITTSATVKESLKNQILKAARHLYLDGPYRRNDPVPYDPSKRWRAFWYLFHGGTTVNPTKFEHGGWSYPGNNADEVRDARQSIGPVIGIYGYAYKLSGDPLFLEAAKELWDSAYGETDGIKTYFDTDGKGFNQHCARAGSLWPWAGMAAPAPSTPPLPLPVPTPTPTPGPTPVPTPTVPRAAITSPATGAKVSGIVTVTATAEDTAGISDVYLVVDGKVSGATNTVPYSFKLDTTKLPNGDHSLSVRAWNKLGKPGDSQSMVFTVANVIPVPTPVPVPAPVPSPAPQPCSMSVTPTELSLPVDGMGTVTVNLQNMTTPIEVTAVSNSGQVSVSPGIWKATGTSASKQFQVAIKKRGGTITFNSGCGSKVVVVKVG